MIDHSEAVINRQRKKTVYFPREARCETEAGPEGRQNAPLHQGGFFIADPDEAGQQDHGHGIDGAGGDQQGDVLSPLPGYLRPV